MPSTAVKTPAMKTFPIDAKAADVMIDTKTMLSAVGNAAIVKLEVRDVDEWVGTSSSPYAKTSARAKAASPAHADWHTSLELSGRAWRLPQRR
jgi:thiosulfate/3-mercaptopyruvate sulfurtransferase